MGRFPGRPCNVLCVVCPDEAAIVAAGEQSGIPGKLWLSDAQLWGVLASVRCCLLSTRPASGALDVRYPVSLAAEG